MKDMFYNYDHHINRKEYPEQPVDPEKGKLEGYSGQWIVYDYKGNEIGIRVYQYAPIRLHFDFSGNIDGDPKIRGFLNNNPITLEIINNFHTVLIKREYRNQIKHNSLDIEIIDDENVLKKDVYYMNLYITLETGERYNLYNEKDGFLSII